jgi:D-glycero-alpha-D-manno-heptose-7-phosphate kinase
MIISRTPFRVSLVGGGSDLPSFYQKETGAVISVSINKYMYIALHRYFDPNKILIKYSRTELVKTFREIQHPIVRQVLSDHQLKGVDINSIADIPSGTGLGSSSSFTVGLINAVKTFKNESVSKKELAQMACDVEILKIGSPIGKQDQYAASFGGLNFIRFKTDGSVEVEKIRVDPLRKSELEENLILVYIGGSHVANQILKKQSAAMNRRIHFQTQKQMVHLACQLKKSLESNSIDEVGLHLHESWLLKKTLTQGISNSEIDEVYKSGLKAGAIGGKLLGAGGAGFLLFYCKKEKQVQFRREMSRFREVKFKFESQGSKIIYNKN